MSARGFHDARFCPLEHNVANRLRQVAIMSTPLFLTYRHLDSSPALGARVRELAGKLERFNNRILRCDVTIESPPGHRHKGGAFAVKVQVTIPGGVINANTAHGSRPQHADVFVALSDAFDSVKRQLQAEAQIH
jgi:ribosome-associated translation inhibitor RaiA